MVRRLNGYQLRPVYQKVPSSDHFFFLIYINDLSGNLLSIVKPFADDTSLFSVENDSKILANELNKDLRKISEWTYNLDLNKHAQEVIFSGKLNKSSHPKNIF